jgi:hypothetical protein
MTGCMQRAPQHDAFDPSHAGTFRAAADPAPALPPHDLWAPGAFQPAVEPVPDLRPSPWRAHLWILGVLGALYAAFALIAWPTSGDSLSVGLGRLALVGGATALGLFGAIATAFVALFRRNGAPLVTAYALTLGIVALIVVAFVAGPG